LPKPDQKPKKPKKPQALLAPYKILIVTANRQIGELVAKAFRNRGASTEVQQSAKTALETVKKVDYDAVILTEEICDESAEWFGVQARKVHNLNIGTLWYIGDNGISFFDGYIKRPFKPQSIIKQIYYSLMIEDDLYGKIRKAS